MQTANENRFGLIPALSERLRDEACFRVITACCILMNENSLREYLPEILKFPFYFMQDNSNPDISLWKILPPDLKTESFIVCPDGETFSCDKKEDISNRFYYRPREKLPEKELISAAAKEINHRNILLKKTEKELSESSIIYVFTDNSSLANLYRQKIVIPWNIIIFPVLCGTTESTENMKISGTYLGILPPAVIDQPGKMPELVKKTNCINSAFVYATEIKHKIFFTKDNGQALPVLEEIARGTEGVIFNTADKDKVVKILFHPEVKEKIIEELCEIKTDIPGVCLPEKILTDCSRKTTGYLMQKAAGFPLINLLFRPERYGTGRNSDIPRGKIIRSILEKVVMINRHGFFLSDIKATNFVINLKPDFETYFIDTDNFSKGNEDQQNSELAGLIFEILASGLSLSRRNTKIGIYFWHRVLEQKLRDRFEQHLQGRKIKPEEWLELFT
jgi:hypothetical protein